MLVHIQAEFQKEDFEEALADTIINPTQENYLNYLRQLFAIQEQSQNFAKKFNSILPDFGRHAWQAFEWKWPSDFDRPKKNPYFETASADRLEKELTEQKCAVS